VKIDVTEYVTKYTKAKDVSKQTFMGAFKRFHAEGILVLLNALTPFAINEVARLCHKIKVSMANLAAVLQRCVGLC
jgi:hypothetical protein